MLNNKRSKNIYCSVVTLLFAMVQSQLTVAATQMYFVHNDQLGTPVAVTDQSQAVVWEADKKPFGESVIMGTVGENTRFPGQVFDEETGLHYNYFRDYDPSLGRYIQSDPIGLAGGLNTYGYVYQNPLSFTDPYGLCLAGGAICVPAAVAAVAAISAGSACAGTNCGQAIVDAISNVFSDSADDKPYEGETPDDRPEDFKRGNDGDKINKNDGSIWSPERGDGHADSKWKRWPNERDRRERKNRESVRPDGSCR